MPTPYGIISTTDGPVHSAPVTEQITEVLPPEEVTEVIVEVESDDE